MIQIISCDRTGPDYLTEIVDAIRHTVMAAGPDAQVNRLVVTPEDRMRVDVRRACITDDVARIVHSGSRGGKKTGRNCQLLNPGRATRVAGVILPNDRKDIALTRNEAGVVNRFRFAYHLTAQQIGRA